MKNNLTVIKYGKCDLSSTTIDFISDNQTKLFNYDDFINHFNSFFGEANNIFSKYKTLIDNPDTKIKTKIKVIDENSIYMAILNSDDPISNKLKEEITKNILSSVRQNSQYSEPKKETLTELSSFFYNLNRFIKDNYYVFFIEVEDNLYKYDITNDLYRSLSYYMNVFKWGQIKYLIRFGSYEDISEFIDIFKHIIKYNKLKIDKTKVKEELKNKNISNIPASVLADKFIKLNDVFNNQVFEKNIVGDVIKCSGKFYNPEKYSLDYDINKDRELKVTITRQPFTANRTFKLEKVEKIEQKQEKQEKQEEAEIEIKPKKVYIRKAKEKNNANANVNINVNANVNSNSNSNNVIFNNFTHIAGGKKKCDICSNIMDNDIPECIVCKNEFKSKRMRLIGRMKVEK